jgi:hypothetical protein
MKNVYIVKNGIYPQSAIEEIQRDKEVVSFHNIGGGFVKILSIEDFNNIFIPYNANNINTIL